MRSGRGDPTSRMWFKTAEGQELDDVKRRALTVLRNVTEGGVEAEIEEPIWALIDISHGSEAVEGACRWFLAAADYSRDEDVRTVLLREAYGKIERALRFYL